MENKAYENYFEEYENQSGYINRKPSKNDWKEFLFIGVSVPYSVTISVLRGIERYCRKSIVSDTKRER